MPWGNTHWFVADERWASLEHRDNNAGAVNSAVGPALGKWQQWQRQEMQHRREQDKGQTQQQQQQHGDSCEQQQCGFKLVHCQMTSDWQHQQQQQQQQRDNTDMRPTLYLAVSNDHKSANAETSLDSDAAVAASLEHAATAYSHWLTSTLKLSQPRERPNVHARLDLVVLGHGEDGHIASLFPQSVRTVAYGSSPPQTQSKSQSQSQPPPQQTQRRSVITVRNSPKPPGDRVTLTMNALAQSARAIIVSTGAGKRDAVTNALRGVLTLSKGAQYARDVTPLEQFVALRLHMIQQTETTDAESQPEVLTWFADPAAAPPVATTASSIKGEKNAPAFLL